MLEKHCSNCKKIKKNDQFFKDKRGKLGVESICKRCRMNRSNENRAKKREQYNEYYRKWRKDNNFNEYARQYFIKNRKEILEKRKKDPLYLEKLNVRWHKRRAKLLGNGGSHTVKEWKDLCEHWGNICAICREKKKLTKDHIIPISKDGTDNIDNIQPLCQRCNSIKKDKQSQIFG